MGFLLKYCPTSCLNCLGSNYYALDGFCHFQYHCIALYYIVYFIFCIFNFTCFSSKDEMQPKQEQRVANIQISRINAHVFL
jgi:hypothetical protein